VAGGVQLSVNGQRREVAYPDEMLVWVLRDEMGLTGTHYGCGIGACGSCTVLLDGQVARACLTPARAAAGREVTTVEGLARGEQLHPVQRAFLENPLQCGWCLPGHLMSAVALLERTPDPTDAQIEEAAGINLCRCGGYNSIRRAVARAAELKREDG
jgi:aerobic-type carbon monoxide dehydrogenase small subunit (CoxS/CutS family)